MIEDMYAEHLLDHYRFLRNRGLLSKKTFTFTDTNQTCGDKLVFDVLVENNKIMGIGFDGVGCAISQAGASILTEHVKGKNVSIIKKMSESDYLKILGVKISPARINCAMLGFKILKNII